MAFLRAEYPYRECGGICKKQQHYFFATLFRSISIYACYILIVFLQFFSKLYLFIAYKKLIINKVLTILQDNLCWLFCYANTNVFLLKEEKVGGVFRVKVIGFECLRNILFLSETSSCNSCNINLSNCIFTTKNKAKYCPVLSDWYLLEAYSFYLFKVII